MVNAHKSDKGGRYEITFTFEIGDIAEVDLITEFSQLWYTSKRPSEFVDFLRRLIIAQRRKRQQQSYTNPYFPGYTQEDVQNLFRQKMGNFDFGGFQGARTRSTTKPPPQPDPAWVKVLGLPKTATKEEIKAKYRQLAKIHHPDKPGGDARKFAEITKAYEEALE